MGLSMLCSAGLGIVPKHGFHHVDLTTGSLGELGVEV